MKVKYRISSIMTPCENDATKIQYPTITQNTEIVLFWVKTLDLTVVSSEIFCNNSKWELILKGKKKNHKLFKSHFISKGSTIYNLTSHKIGWFN